MNQYRSTSHAPSKRNIGLYLCVTAIVCTVPIRAATAQDVTTVFEVLKALYKSTDGRYWYNQWDTTTVPDEAALNDWYGITYQNGALTSINLYDNNLSGLIPPELGRLTELRFLSLANNPLVSTIPLELTSLEKLEHLHLYATFLWGPIPRELGNLTSLVELLLYHNGLVGSIPPELGDLANLEELNLDYNLLSGAIPPQLGNLANLEALSLAGNALESAIPPELSALANLQILVLERNLLSGAIPPQLSKLTNLQSLALNQNAFSGAIPPQLGDLATLEFLSLHSNSLTGAIPPELGKLTKLQNLYLFYNDLSGPVPQEIGHLTKMTELLIDSNRLTGQLPTTMGAMTALRSLHYRDNAGLCAPLNAAFQAWLQTINDVRGPNCDPSTSTESASAPEATFTLHGSYPNPFSREAQLTFDLSQPASIHIEIYDMIGRQRYADRSLIRDAGKNQAITLSGALLLPGQYLVRAVATFGHEHSVRTSLITIIR